ncbi:cytochrome c biogenesis heme-transporting ATPase CcmA [Idiomarina xiamenensis]|uniref:ATP binding protein of heme exporter A n=1 Tax=Idiomarina xiamenensis 10-D-4 TaxID=740709 RepID=K2JC01_9GAMM|nr:cytochrome c biogenesis heme-transporting ATPase CcmA [Idiomarina xiamenensis]EKE80811.1 ATP binding protein of heme exporter A [Idiomarina xiamenensis 10-D-4]
MVALLQASALACSRGDRTLFSDLSLSVCAGQLWHVEGINGAGKSTLLRTLAGLLPLQQGQIEYRQQPLAEQLDGFYRELLFIGHKAAVKADLTALENLAFQRQMDGVAANVNDDWDILERIGLLGLEDIPARQLSAGQQRRIALARLWANQATMWILDEPFTALDQPGIRLLQQRFLSHLDAGGAIVMTSHQALHDFAGDYRRLTLLTESASSTADQASVTATTQGASNEYA